MNKKWLVLTVAVAVIAATSQAGIIAPTEAVANTHDGFGPASSASNLIDAARLNGSNQLVPGSWVSGWVGTDAWGTWENWVYIDLGAEYNLEEIRIWNYTETDTANNFIGRGVKAGSVWVAGEGAALPTVETPGFAIDGDGSVKFSGWTNFWAGDLAIGETGTDPVDAQNVFDATGTNGVRYVGIDINSRWGGDAWRGLETDPSPGYLNYAPSLGYVQVSGVIPEPATLVLLGLGSLVTLRRRRA
jgi:hypothetical protein